mgnify:CR=1 FL=1
MLFVVRWDPSEVGGRHTKEPKGRPRLRSTRRTPRDDKLARIYDDEILPIWSERFGRMLLRGVADRAPPRAMVLDVGCATGLITLGILPRLDDQSRIIAIEPSPGLLATARKKVAAKAGKRVFFRGQDAGRKLPFADDVYDLVLCNLGLADNRNPQRALADFVRVAKPGGRIACTVPLAGTWGELYDIFREVLIKKDRHEAMERLDEHLGGYPQPSDIDGWLVGAGLIETAVEVQEFSLLFRSSREFFFAPLVDFGPLSRWKQVAGQGREVQDVFWDIKQAIDLYFAGRAFRVTVRACCFVGTKAERTEADSAADEPMPTTEESLLNTGNRGRTASASGPSIFLESGDLEVVEGSGGLKRSDGEE